MPWPLYHQERLNIYSTGGWLVLGASLDWQRNSCHLWDSIARPSNLHRVGIPTLLSQLQWHSLGNSHSTASCSEVLKWWMVMELLKILNFCEDNLFVECKKNGNLRFMFEGLWWKCFMKLTETLDFSHQFGLFFKWKFVESVWFCCHVKEIKCVTIFVGSIKLSRSVSQYLSSDRAYLSVVHPTEQLAYFYFFCLMAVE